jgi:hypothetical protein
VSLRDNTRRFYYQNFQTFFPPKTENGVLTFTLPATSNISMFDVNDMGAAVTACIEKPSRWGHGNVIPLCGDHLTPQQIVDTFNHANGTKAVVNLGMVCARVAVPSHMTVTSSAARCVRQIPVSGRWRGEHVLFVIVVCSRVRVRQLAESKCKLHACVRR